MHTGAHIICYGLSFNTRIGLHPHNAGDLACCPFVHNHFANWPGPVYVVALVLPSPSGRWRTSVHALSSLWYLTGSVFG